MEEIIYGITFFVYALFIIRTLLSWIGGDFDIDCDLDLGDIVSFKGLTHFLMGSFGWLSSRLALTHTTMWYDYLIAICIGIIFSVMLFGVYMFMSKLESKPTIISGKVTVYGDSNTGAQVAKSFVENFTPALDIINKGFGKRFGELFDKKKLPTSEKKDENNFDEVK